MKPPRLKSGVAFFIAVLALSLVACGRRGALEPPPGAAASNPAITGTPGEEEAKPANSGELPEQNTANSKPAATPAQTGATQAPPHVPRPFVLDPLL
ncbi:MAG TPA: lipoprotein [Methylocella sp.]|nr:lipoprotein [Methylocella sp.]